MSPTSTHTQQAAGHSPSTRLPPSHVEELESVLELLALLGPVLIVVGFCAATQLMEDLSAIGFCEMGLGTGLTR